MNKTFRLVPKHLNQGAQNDQAQSMQSEQHPLLFINRFSNESIKGCHGPSRTAVSVHVQRTIRRQKKQDRLTRLRSREVSKGFLKHQLALIDDEAVSGPLLRTPSPLIHYSRQAPSASYDKTLLSDSRRDQCDLQSERATSSRVQTISHIITPEPSTAAFDNKTSLPQPQSMSAMVALEFFLDAFLPRVFQIPSQAAEHGQWVVQRAVKSQVLYQAVTAVGAASHLALITSLLSHHDNLNFQYDAKMLEIIAVKHLRLCLDTSETMEVATLIQLTISTICNGNMSAIKVHANALSHFMRSQIAQAMIPIHVMETFISDTIALHHHLAFFGQAFFDPSVEAALGPKLVQLFRNMRALTLWHEHYYLTRFLALNLPYAVTPAATKVSRNIGVSRQEKPYQAQYLQQSMQEPCRIALLIFWNACNQVDRPGSLLYRRLSAQLEIALKAVLPGSSHLMSLWELLDKHLHKLLLWVLLLGAFITHDSGLHDGIDDNDTFLMQLVEYVRLTSIDGKLYSLEEIERSLNQFLYLERIFGNSMGRLWARLTEQRDP